MKLSSHVFLPVALAIVGAGLLAGLAPSAALACKCAPPPEPAAALAEATVVFEGRVTSIADASDVQGEKRVTLSVVRTWKGLADEETVVVRTRAESAACGYPFEAGTSYVVYAGGDALAPSVSHCSRTRPLSDANDDMHALGAGITPVQVRTDAGTANSVGDTDAGLADDAGRAPATPGTSSGGCATGRSGTKSSLMWLGLPLLSLLKRRRRTES